MVLIPSSLQCVFLFFFVFFSFVFGPVTATNTNRDIRITAISSGRAIGINCTRAFLPETFQLSSYSPGFSHLFRPRRYDFVTRFLTRVRGFALRNGVGTTLPCLFVIP